jgi:site-specific DNA-methyltransferase (adenine-specific)
MSGILDLAGFGSSRNSRALLFKQDVMECLQDLDDASVDLVVTDPPYDSLEKHRKKGTTTRLKQSKASSNVWFETIPDSYFPQIFTELYRVLQKNSHLYVFCDHSKIAILSLIGMNAGFKYWKPLIWDKCSIGMGYHYRCRYECILLFEKGKRRLSDLSVPDVLRYSKVFRSYPTEKPVALLQTLIKQSSDLGALVLDPFFGSGSCALAAMTLGRDFVGSDNSDHAHKAAAEKLNMEGCTNHSVMEAMLFQTPLRRPVSSEL